MVFPLRRHRYLNGPAMRLGMQDSQDPGLALPVRTTNARLDSLRSGVATTLSVGEELVGEELLGGEPVGEELVGDASVGGVPLGGATVGAVEEKSTVSSAPAWPASG